MNKVFIMLVGEPASGKTATNWSLYNYIGNIYKNGTPTMFCYDTVYPQVINSKEFKSKEFPKENLKNDYIRDQIIAIGQQAVSRWAIKKDEDASSVMIYDDRNLTVYDRKRILGRLPEGTIKVAIHMNRIPTFCRNHNGNSGHREVSTNTLICASRTIQQPIYDEGFHVIHHVDANHHLRDHKVISKIATFSNNFFSVNKLPE